VLMSLAWGFLIPSGAFISLAWRSRLAKGRWLQLHRALQVSGLLLTIVGFALSVSWVPDGYHFSHPHNIIGLVVVVLAMLQPLNSLARGKPAAATGGKRTTRRAVWELMHKGGGYAIIIMGVYQAVSGRYLMIDGDPILITYFVLLGLSLVILISGLIMRRSQGPAQADQPNLAGRKADTVSVDMPRAPSQTVAA